LRNELVTRNVADIAEGPNIPAPERREWTGGDVTAVLEAVEGTEEQGPVAVALLAGLRLAEALGLRWGDVVLDRRTIHVRHTLQRLNGGFVAGEPKSATSRRGVPMGDRLHRIIEVVREREIVKRRELGIGAITNDTLAFITEFAEPIDPTSLTKRLGKRLKAAGLERRTFHDLRHGFGSALAASGKDTFVISRLMGHSGIAVTGEIRVVSRAACRQVAVPGSRTAWPGAAPASPPSGRSVTHSECHLYCRDGRARGVR
jgi:integrase